MSRDAVISSWLESMSKSELIYQLLFWHDTALEHGRMYNAVQDENAKLRELCKELLDLCYDAYNQEWGWDDDWALAYERAKKLGVDDG